MIALALTPLSEAVVTVTLVAGATAYLVYTGWRFTAGLRAAGLRSTGAGRGGCGGCTGCGAASGTRNA